MIFNDASSTPREIRTRRLLLRPMRLDDAADLFEYARDPRVARYVTWPAHETLDDSYRFLTYVMRQNEVGSITSWGIVESASNQFIGTIGCTGIDGKHFRTELGYALSHAHWGRGLMTEAVRALIDHLFRETDLNRIEAVHDVLNPASGRVMEKSGMTCEGLSRQCRFIKERFIDLKQYAILREDWQASRRR